MEEIILSAQTNRAPDVPDPGDLAVALPELRDRLDRSITECRRRRDQRSLTAKARRRRSEEFQAAIKTLVKNTASEIARPIDDRRCRMETRTRMYAALMVLADAAARERETATHEGRTARLHGIAVTIAMILVLGIVAASRGWLVLAPP